MVQKDTVLTGILGGSIGIITAGFIIAVYFGALSIITGAVENASDYGAFVTGIATIALVIITGVYTHLTSKQASIMEEQLEQERELFRQQREQDWAKTTRSILDRMDHLLKTNPMNKLSAQEFSQFQTKFDALIEDLKQQPRRKPPTLDESGDVNTQIRNFIEIWYNDRERQDTINEEALLSQIDDLKEAVGNIMDQIESHQQDDDTTSGKVRPGSTKEGLAGSDSMGEPNTETAAEE